MIINHVKTIMSALKLYMIQGFWRVTCVYTFLNINHIALELKCPFSYEEKKTSEG